MLKRLSFILTLTFIFALTVGAFTQGGLPEKAIEIGGPVLIWGIAGTVLFALFVAGMFKYFILPLIRERFKAADEQVTAVNLAREHDMQAMMKRLETADEHIREVQKAREEDFKAMLATSRETVKAMEQVASNLAELNRRRKD